MVAWLEIDGRKRRVKLPSSLADSPDGPMQCVVDGCEISVDTRSLQPGVMSLIVDGRQYRCILDGDAVLIGGRRFPFERSDPRSLQGGHGAGAGATGPRSVKAPMPGRVVRVLVAVGDDVAEQQGVVVIEAMKMQNELRSPKAGKVVRVTVAAGDTVASGDVLAVVE